MADSSPAIQRSKGAGPDTTVRSKVAMALAMLVSVTPSPGKAMSKAVR